VTARPPDEPRPPRPPAPDGWAGFRRRHSAWLAGLRPGEPIYRIPRPLLSALRPRRSPPRAGWLDDAAARAEVDLGRLCDAHDAVGFLDGSPVRFRLLAPGPASPLGVSELRLKGYVGRLLTHPGFLLELAEQRRLQDSRDPHAPAAPPVLAGEAAGDDPFASFCGRWGLAGLAAWDLPVPLPALLSPGPPAPGGGPAARGVSLFIPFHQALDDELVRRARRMLRGLAAPGFDPGPSHHLAFGRMLDVLHLERVAAGRYGPASRGSGFVARLVLGVARSLEITEFQVRKWRKAISARLRRGDAAVIPSFRGPDPG